MQTFFETNGWNIVDKLNTEPRAAELLPVDDLPLMRASRVFLETRHPNGIYKHQKEALRRALGGEDVCLVTGTASGKSLVFQSAAVDLLARDPDARIMAIYPMKALGNEQRDRWQSTLEQAGLIAGGDAVGRIDGSVPPGFRLNILERSRVVVFTPDIIHAWMFSNLNQPEVIRFLKRVRLIVVDEVHAYSGVFGSNAAFLFRRLDHVLRVLETRPNLICASATIARPEQHLRSLLGRAISLVGPEMDTSPRYPLEVYLVDPPGTGRFLDEVVKLLGFLTGQGRSRFIAFVDSRKQVELISSILNRLLKQVKEEAAAAAAAEAGETSGGGRGRGRAKAKPVVEEEEPDPEGEVTGALQSLNVLPYRAGYEDHDRKQIQERLADGTLNGVVSTSALELGIDIPNLDLCVLIGVPASATSLQQRIGRIGRHSPGTVVVVSGGDVHDRAVFANPQSFFQRPLAESALYLENEHIQYIHALCLARAGGEHDQAAAAAGISKEETFSSPVEWSPNFLALCEKERAGTVPRHLASLKLEGRERPNYTFPLRDVESQFKVERRDGPNVASMGSMSFAQLMREAYPGAIYYYATIPYRVTRVNVKAKVVQVRREKRYTTQPQRTLPAVFPRLNPGGVAQAVQQGALLGFETSLLVRESIRGVIEQRGRNESLYPYPLARELGFYQDQPYFSRNYFTTGVLLTHPALEAEGVNLEAAASLLYEAFLLMTPIERQDVGFAADHFRAERLGPDGKPVIREGQPFLALYDQTYGSLRLSSRLLEPSALGRVLAEAALLAVAQSGLGEQSSTRGILAEMAKDCIRLPRTRLEFRGAEQVERSPGAWERIVLPGSKGLMIRTNEEFHVLRILQTPVGLSYEGTPTSMLGSSASVMPLLSDVAEIPGESQTGWYNLENGAIEPAVQAESMSLHAAGLPEPAAALLPGLPARLLATYLSVETLQQLARQFGVSTEDDKQALAERLAESVPAADLISAAVDQAS